MKIICAMLLMLLCGCSSLIRPDAVDHYQYEGKIVFVMLNGTDSETTVPLKFYKEILKDKKEGKDILSGKTILFEKELKMEARESLIIEL